MRKPKQQEGLNFSNNSLPKTESISMSPVSPVVESVRLS